jgi:hypothetical protein
MSSSWTRRRLAAFKFLIALVPVLIAFAPGESEGQTYPGASPIAGITTEQAERAEANFLKEVGGADIDPLVEVFSAVAYPPEASQVGQLTQPQPVEHLGMYVGAPDQPGWGADGGGAVLRGNGLRASDTAGFLPAGETLTVRDTSGNGGIIGTFDATRFFGLPSNNSLLFTGAFDYQRDSASLGAVSPTGVAFSTGSVQSDTYTFRGSVFYRSGTTYLLGTADYNFGRSNETSSHVGSTGSFNSNGYSVDAKLGNVFVLLNTTGASTSATLPTKAPPKPAGGTLVGLDLSGHIGSFGNWANGFTDSTGFIFGTDQVRSGDIGGRAELFALMPGNGLLWKPYVAGTVDQLFGFSSTLTIPSQVAQPGITDVFNLQAARTFGGAELGVDARGSGGWTVNVKGFYLASANTNITGGSMTVKIPFNYLPTVASRY